MSTYRFGRDTKVKFIAVVRASPSTVVRGRGAVTTVELIVCGMIGSPASVSQPVETYAVARERAGRRTEASPFTPMNELLGGSDSLPRDGVAAMSVARNGLSKKNQEKSVWEKKA